MATIRKRIFQTREVWEVQLRRRGLPHFSLSFATKEEAQEWAVTNEKQYVLNPEKYREWIQKERINLKWKREFGAN